MLILYPFSVIEGGKDHDQARLKVLKIDKELTVEVYGAEVKGKDIHGDDTTEKMSIIEEINVAAKLEAEAANPDSVEKDMHHDDMEISTTEEINAIKKMEAEAANPDLV